MFRKLSNRIWYCACSFLLLQSFATISGAQTPAGMETPVWVTMMEDPNVNYFDALKAYDAYWLTHTRPAGEEEEMEMNLSEKDRSSKDAKEAERERERREERKKKLKGASLEQMEYLKYQCKRFENWAREVKPWVQSDGHVLTDAERLEIWKKQQTELKQQESK